MDGLSNTDFGAAASAIKNPLEAYQQGASGALNLASAQQKFTADDLNQKLKMELLPLQLKSDKIKLATSALPDRKLMLALASRDPKMIEAAIQERQQLASMPVGSSSLELSDKLGATPISEYLGPGELDLLKKQADYANQLGRIDLQSTNRMAIEEFQAAQRRALAAQEEAAKGGKQTTDGEMKVVDTIQKKFGKKITLIDRDLQELLAVEQGLKTPEAKRAFNLYFSTQLPKARAKFASVPPENNPPAAQPSLAPSGQTSAAVAPQKPAIADGQVKVLKSGQRYRFDAQKNMWMPLK